MPLQGFLKTSEPSRISTISAGTKEKRKKITPPSSDGEQVYVIMRVADCLNHDHPHPTASVELMQYQEGGGWDSKGLAKCCPLCWKILEFPDGFNPEVIPQVLGTKKKPATPAQKAALRRGRKSSSRSKTGPKKNTIKQFETVLNMAWMESVTVYDVMDRLQVSRVRARAILEAMVKTGTLIAHRTGAGRGHQTSYEKTP